MNRLTKKIDKILTAIVLNEPNEMSQEIIDRCVCTTNQMEITKLLYSERHFLKCKYQSHVVENDNICYHGLNTTEDFIIGTIIIVLPVNFHSMFALVLKSQ